MLAMFVGNLTPILIISGACGIAAGSALQITLLQNAMLIAGIVTLVQLFAIGPCGGKVPIIMGTSSGFIGVCNSVAGIMGNGVVSYGAIMGACILGGLFESVLGFLIKPLRKFFPPVVTGTVAFSIVAAVAIFMILPYFLSTLMKPVIPSYHLRTVIEGVFRIGIFIVYILLISRMEDIQRTFMYHGAEHKCINCIEHGLPLTVENVRKSSRQHKRCGTSFLFFVLAISIILLLLIRVESPLMRVVVRIALLPVIAGISYEVLKLAGNSENALVNLLSKPGMAIQMI